MLKRPRCAPFQYVDAQRQRNRGGHPNESRDCTVRSLALAANIRYEDAHAAFELGGRHSLHGAMPSCGLEVTRELGIIQFRKITLRPEHLDADGTIGNDEPLFTREELKNPRAKFHPRTASGIGGYWSLGQYCYTSHPSRRITLGMLLKKLPKGHYIFATIDHAFAVIDGVVHDSQHIALANSIFLCYQIMEA
jgi:hypothetical protein